MSYKVYELRDSESGSIDTENLEAGEVWNITKKYVIGQCPGGMAEAKSAIAGYLPRYAKAQGGYWRRKSMSLKGIGRQCFECTGEYTTLIPGADSKDDQPDGNSNVVPGSIAWDTTGGTEHITSARGERVVFGDGTEDFGGAINVQGTSVAGIDRVIASMKYSETWVLDAQVALSETFVNAVYTLTGTVNAEQFRAFSPGEALFLGARAQWTTDNPYVSVTFDFQARANEPDYYVKGLGTTFREGWEYPWLVYSASSTGSGLLVQRPTLLIIDVIYKKASWAPLKIVGRTIGTRRSGASPASAASASAAEKWSDRFTSGS